MISIIIPALNEGGAIAGLLEQLQPLRERGDEVILADGGSDDETRQQAADLVDRLLVTAPGRARQMNAAAEVSRGDQLWFLHVDSGFDARSCLMQARERVGQCAHWGRFDIRLSGTHPLLRVVENLMNLRSRLTGIATGDQGIVVRRALFTEVGGYPDIPLMEDVAISKRLRRVSRPEFLTPRLITSSRRWERNGILRTILLMWRLRLAYALGADPAELARRYRLCSTPTQNS